MLSITWKNSVAVVFISISCSSCWHRRPCSGIPGSSITAPPWRTECIYNWRSSWLEPGKWANQVVNDNLMNLSQTHVWFILWISFTQHWQSAIWQGDTLASTNRTQVCHLFLFLIVSLVNCVAMAHHWKPSWRKIIQRNIIHLLIFWYGRLLFRLRSATDLSYRQIFSLDGSSVEVEIVDVSNHPVSNVTAGPDILPYPLWWPCVLCPFPLIF